MALSITSPVKTNSGITLATSYGRVTSIDPLFGTNVEPYLSVYATEDDFINNSATVAVVSITGEAVPQQFNIPYNRQADGVDTLMFSHTGIQAQLMGMGIDSTIEGLD
tara:strand:- start:2484 stop:2807 length:324 start_codon:yes stop_codon:yes gene_type:complete